MDVVHKSLKSLQTFKTKLSGKDAFGLLIITTQLQKVNGALPQTIAQWVAKNSKPLTKLNEKWNLDIAAVNEKFCAPAPKGKKGFLYHQRGIEIKMNATNGQVDRGDEGYPDPNNPQDLISIHTKRTIRIGKDHVDAGIPFEVKLIDPEKDGEYADALKEVQEKEYDVQLFKINPSIFESLKVAIPSADDRGVALQLPVLYDNLMIDEEDETDNK